MRAQRLVTDVGVVGRVTAVPAPALAPRGGPGGRGQGVGLVVAVSVAVDGLVRTVVQSMEKSQKEVRALGRGVAPLQGDCS